MNLNRSFLAHVINCFVTALNEKQHLPRYILIVLDKDWLANCGILEYGASKAIKVAIQWLVQQFNHSIEIRKENLYQVKPGALATGSEPRMVWLTMLKRLIIRDAKLAKILSLTCRFNQILEEVLFQEHHSHILKVNIPDDRSYFDM